MLFLSASIDEFEFVSHKTSVVLQEQAKAIELLLFDACSHQPKPTIAL